METYCGMRILFTPFYTKNAINCCETAHLLCLEQSVIGQITAVKTPGSLMPPTGY